MSTIRRLLWNPFVSVTLLFVNSLWLGIANELGFPTWYLLVQGGFVVVNCLAVMVTTTEYVEERLNG